MAIIPRIMAAITAPFARGYAAATAANASWLAASNKNPWTAGNPAAYAPEALTAVYAAESKLNAGLCGADWQIARKLSSGGSTRIMDGRAAGIIASTPLETWKRLINDWLLTGNGFGEIKNGKLVHLPFARATLVRKDGTEEHHLRVSPLYSDVAEIRHLDPSEFLHLKMLPSNSELLGQSPLDRLSPGLSLAVQVISSATQVLGNAANPGAILVAPGLSKPEARDRLRADFAKTFSSNSGGAGKTVVLDFDAKVERLPTVESMLADSMVKLAKFGVSEVARAYGVPLSLLAETADTNRSTSIEESRQFSIFGVAPLASQLADSLSQFLLSDAERASGQRVVLDLRDALLGYGQERAQYASTLVNSGLASRNEIRDLLGLPDTDGGDAIAAPANTIPLAQWLEKPADPPPPVTAAPADDPTKFFAGANNIRPPDGFDKITPTPADAESRVVDLRVYASEARLKAVTNPSAFNRHVENLVQRNTKCQ